MSRESQRESEAEPIKNAPPGQVRGLPPFAKNLLGRVNELSLVRNALLRDEIRLLTIGRPAGIGKSRLAVEVAKDLASEFPDGVWFVELSGISDPDSVPSAIAEGLGMRRVPFLSALDRLQHYLQDRRLLLILDNFEHVGAFARMLSDLLASHPGLRILVTSGSPLRLKWEHTLILEPLQTPRSGERQSLDDIAAASAIQLFVQGAQAVRLDFTLTSENVDDVVAICAYLQGVPLAIELAASWIAILPPAAIRGYLRREPSFLQGRMRDIPARQQSLAAELDWSYDLLDQRERALLRRLSVFVGEFTIEAAMAVSGDSDPDVLDALVQSL
jgi:predicted ATPase